MHIPEWEIEESLASNPGLLGLVQSKEIELIGRQKYLKDLGRYIDLVYKKGDTYFIVEVKSDFINQKSVIIDQLLQYKKGLSKELGVPEGKITCILTSPAGFSKDIAHFAHKAGIITIKLDHDQITNSLEKPQFASQFTLVRNDKLKSQLRQILTKRGFPINLEEVSPWSPFKSRRLRDEINSLNTLLELL